MLWFVFLYVLAGYIKLYPVKIKRLKLITILTIAIVTICFILIKLILSSGSNCYLKEPVYNGLIVFVSGLLFLNVKGWNFRTTMKRSQIIGTIAASTLGVYLITDGLLRNVIWEEFYEWQTLMSSIWGIPIMFVVCAIIFAISILIDMIVERILDFMKLDLLLYNVTSKLINWIK